MMLRCWRDRLGRRAALREMNQHSREHEAVLLGQNHNSLNLAKLSVGSDPVEAAAQWELACQVMPIAVVNLTIHSTACFG